MCVPCQNIKWFAFPALLCSALVILKITMLVRRKRSHYDVRLESSWLKQTRVSSVYMFIYRRGQCWMLTCIWQIYWFCSGTEIKNLANILHRFRLEYSFLHYLFPCLFISNRYICEMSLWDFEFILYCLLALWAFTYHNIINIEIWSLQLIVGKFPACSIDDQMH